MQTVFVRPPRCIGCRQCEYACAVAHSKSRDPVLALFEDPRPHSRIHVEAGPSFHTSFPSLCRHCDPAPCVQACPTGAMHRDQSDELVLVEPRRCIGCAMCAMACPFGVVTFHAASNGLAEQRTVATKCDGCVDRRRLGQEPACSEACKSRALVFGELNDLVQADRLNEARSALAPPERAAVASEPEIPSLPETVLGWRVWGQSATHVAQGGTP